MKLVKLFGLAVLAGALLSALIGTGTAMGAANFCTVQESPCKEANRWAAGTELDFSIASGNSSILVNTSGEELDKCTEATAKGKIEKAEAVTAPIESLTWGGCTFPTNTLTKGKLEVKNIAGTHNGTVLGDAITEVTINTVFFGSCIYGFTSGTSIGDLTEGKPAVFHANAVAEKFTGSAFACPATSKWTGTFTLTEPKEKTLSVEAGTVPTEPSVFCTAQESPCKEANLWAAGTELDLSLKSGTSAQLTNTAGTEALDKCTESTAKGKLEAAEAVTGSWQSLTWGGCTFETTTTLLGKFEVKQIGGTHNGTVKADGESRITINGGFFGSCIYGAAAETDLGELKEGKPALFAVNAVVNKLSGSAAACPESAKWTAEYTLTEPKEKTLSVEAGTLPSEAPVFCTVIESPCKEANRWAAGAELDFSIASGNSTALVNTAGEELDICTEATAKGKIEKAEPVTGPIESLTWGKCTFPTTTLETSRLKVDRIAGTSNGTVTADGPFRVTINTVFFGSCIYGVTSGNSIGDLTEGKPAVFHANAVAEKFTGSAFACPSTSKWTGTFTLTEPKEKTLAVETT